MPVLPDPETMMVAWVKGDVVLRPLLGYPAAVRVATRYPIHGLVTPFMRVVGVGGTRESGEAPIGNPLMQWDVIAQKPGGGPDFAAASLIMRTLVDRLDAVNSGAVEVDGAVFCGVRFTNGPYRVEGEPDTEYARYLLESEIWTK